MVIGPNFKRHVVRKEKKGIMVSVGLQVQLEIRGNMVHEVCKACKVYKAIEVQVVLMEKMVKKAKKEIRETREILVPPV